MAAADKLTFSEHVTGHLRKTVRDKHDIHRIDLLTQLLQFYVEMYLLKQISVGAGVTETPNMEDFWVTLEAFWQHTLDRISSAPPINVYFRNHGFLELLESKIDGFDIQEGLERLKAHRETVNPDYEEFLRDHLDEVSRRV